MSPGGTPLATLWLYGGNGAGGIIGNVPVSTGWHVRTPWLSAAYRGSMGHWRRMRRMSLARLADILDQTSCCRARVAHPARAIPVRLMSSCRVLPQIS